MRVWIGTVLAAFIGISASTAAAEIPYRYSMLEGFILTLDDSGRNAVAMDDLGARAVLDRLAVLLESDRYRIPTEYGRTLSWHEGQVQEPGMDRAAQLAVFNQARLRDASRAQPGNVLFTSVVLREKSDGSRQLRIRIDWVDLVRGEVEARYVMDPIALDGDLSDAMTAIDPFLRQVGDDLLVQLGPAPPRGYGEVPPPWLIEPIRYRVDFRDLPADIRADAADALTFDFDHYLSHDLVRETDDRLTLSYETTAPSWWLAEQLASVFEDLGYAVTILPRVYGLRVVPAQ